MKLERTRAEPEDIASSASAMRTQRRGRVVAVLDGDAHLHVWEPNRGDEPIDIDLTPSLATIVDLGIDARPAPEPHWNSREGCTTLIVSLDTGAEGVITIDGHRISDAAAVTLAANGFIEMIEGWVADRAARDPDDAGEASADESGDCT